MIGFDVPDKLKDLKKNLLWNQQIFTGEAKPNVIRLLPSLALKKNRNASPRLESELLCTRLTLLTSEFLHYVDVVHQVRINRATQTWTTASKFPPESHLKMFSKA